MDLLSKEFYKEQIKKCLKYSKNSNNFRCIAKAQVRRNELKEQTKGKIETLQNISIIGITNFKKRIDSALWRKSNK